MFDYQKAVQIRSNKNTTICNWARILGKTYTTMSTILNDKPESVLYIKITNDRLRVLGEKLSEILQRYNNIEESIRDKSITTSKIDITYKNGKRTSIYNYYMLPMEHEVMNFDYIIFDGLLPRSLKNIYGERIISFVTVNNQDHHLERLFGSDVVILNEDYETALKNNLTNMTNLERIKSVSSSEEWYNEFDILNSPKVNIDKKYNDFNASTNRQYELYCSYPIDNPSKKFIIDSLAGLEDEYDAIDKIKDTVLTRKNLLEMIIQLQRELNR